MSVTAAKKRKKNVHFWRACRYLGPYRRIVSVSIVSAFFMALIYTGGLGAMLPILRVLVNGDTIADWADQQIAEKRLDVTLVQQPSYEKDKPPVLLVTHVGEKGVA